MACLRSAVPAIRLQEPSWAVVRHDDFSIEFNIGDSDPVNSVMLHIRGGPAALDVVREVSRVLGLPAIDCGEGSLIDFSAPNAAASFDAWRAYRDRVVTPGTDET